MKSYIFITTDGYTFQPDRESIEPDIENCQVIGFAQGDDEKQAFENLIQQNDYLLDTTFDELICYELKNTDYHKYVQYFYLGNYELIISDIDAGGSATIDLYYDKETNKVKEEKFLADKTLLTTEFAIEEFNSGSYGNKGVEFLDKINIVPYS